MAVLDRGIAFANEKTDWDIDLGRIYLSPFHHSPLTLYRAYQGKEDLPLQVEIDSLFIGHRGQDTLVYTRSLRLHTVLKTRNSPPFRTGAGLDIPIVVEKLLLDETTFHSDSLIATVGVDVILRRLEAASPELLIAEWRYPLRGLCLEDADVKIDLRPDPHPSPEPPDTSSVPLCFDIQDAKLRNIRFRLTPLDMTIGTGALDANALVDVGANRYEARQINAGGLEFSLGNLRIPADTLYGEACADIANNLVTARNLHVRSSGIGAEADLSSARMDIGTLCVEAAGEAEYKGSRARFRAAYDIPDEAYNANVYVRRLNLKPLLPNSPKVALEGEIAAQGRGINPQKPLSTHIRMRLDKAVYGSYDFSRSSVDFATGKTTALALSMPGAKADIQAPVPLMTLIGQIQSFVETVSTVSSLQDLGHWPALRRRVPALKADIALQKGSPLRALIDSTGIGLEQAALSLRSDARRTDLTLDALTSGLSGSSLPSGKAAVRVGMTDERIEASVNADMHPGKLLKGIDRPVQTTLDLVTDTATMLALSMPGAKADIRAPMPIFPLIEKVQQLVRAAGDSATLNGITSLRNLAMIDSLRARIPAMRADIALQKGSPLQALIDSTGLDLEQAALSLRSDARRTDLTLNATTNDLSYLLPDTTAPHPQRPMRLPAVATDIRVAMEEGTTQLSLAANTHLTDGVMNIYGLCTDAALNLELERREDSVQGNGQLALDSLCYELLDLGSRVVNIRLSPSGEYDHALCAKVETEDIPLEMVEGIVHLKDIALRGALRAGASVDGLPHRTDISARLLPLGVGAEYTPYKVGLSLGGTPIVMEHNRVDFNGLPVYGADSTFIALNGGLDLNTMKVDLTLEADSFAPAKLPKGGPVPVYGDLATGIHGKVTGPLDSIVADVDVTILPSTDITYPIDKKNLAQVKPHGTVKVRYALAEREPLSLGGRVSVDDGMLRYSPKAYPVMPFKVDSGSHVAFHGPVGKTQIHVSASQKVKADVESEEEDTRRVDFRTGVRVNGELDSLGLESIDFFLEAPEDEPVTRELAAVDEGTREGLAATLLATGMYVGESNVAAQREGYALSSIINSRINAAMANSKVGKFMDIDISSGQTRHAAGKSNDMNIAISKSFLKDRLRITIGSTISDNPEVNKTNGLLSSLSADYRILPGLSVRLYSQRDYNNILEGELNKSGLGLLYTKEWRRHELFRGDSLARTHSISADAGVAYRSNNSIGPDLTLKYSLKNVLGNGETFTLKGNGAYYWALRNRHPGDPKKTDTYKLGVNAALVFPYLHWAGDNNPDGDTKYMLGYQYENIAGGYGVHKLTGALTYFFHSENNPYITHAFTPFSLSVVLMKAESENLLDKAAEYPQLIKVIAGNEFVPSIGYNFIYNDYTSKRAVNTMLDLGVKESGNLLNALYCAFGHAWNEQDKPLGKITFNQFVKLSAELRNRFNLTDKVSIATRLFAGANIPLGNSSFAPLSEAFYAGGPNSMRSASPYAYGPGNFYSAKYNQNFFHAGDVKLEANVELRFPIVWKLYGAAFLDAGNVWNWYSTVDLFKAAGYEDYLARLEIPQTLYDGLYHNPDFAKQIALGTGAGLRLDLEGLVIRLDLGVGIHAPYQTFKYDKEGKTDTTQPINSYFNIPSAWDAVRVNFGIGYPF